MDTKDSIYCFFQLSVFEGFLNKFQNKNFPSHIANEERDVSFILVATVD